MGADVTVVEVLPQIMPVEDAEVSPASPASSSRSRA
jgi:pyruvate/2-oxoglutarate dehydrogenase complex dihydrolipoamide dehydrogenase (E3) component